MSKILSTLAATIVICLGAQAAFGQCAYERPKKAKKFQVELTQAMYPCALGSGGADPDTTTEDGIDACGSPSTFGESFGTVFSWEWFSKSRGTLLLKAAKKDKSGLGLDGDTATDGGADNPDDIGDIQVRLKLSNIIDGTGGLADGTGILTMILRVTFNDRLNGDLNMLDVPLLWTFDLVNGKTNFNSSVNVPFETVHGIAPLPRCASLEVIGIQVLDATGQVFARPGLFVAPL